MLALSRCIHESIEIRDGVNGPIVLTVTVISIQRGQVRLAFDADRRWIIHRKEVREKMDGVSSK
jgi:carbon storage regulator CsrA